MAVFAREAPSLGEAAARAAIDHYATKQGVTPAGVTAAVTHLVAVTCTGFFAPGLDFVLAHQLRLHAGVERLMIGFMGCSAMFNALRTAKQIVQADPAALVLVVSVELCSLHSQPNPLRDHLIGSSVFADGASACLVGLPDERVGDYYTLQRFYTCMKPNTEEEMAWRIGDYGFDLRLSPRVPDHLAEAAPAALDVLFGGALPQFWAIHPGGRAIIDRLAGICQLDDTQVAASRAVLRRVGNVSSATILMVLAELAAQLGAQGRLDNSSNGNGAHPDPSRRAQSGVAMAFGPGLVLEMAQLGYVPLCPVPTSGAQPALQLAAG
jgi:predicted naringenin-chalcone synthase